MLANIRITEVGGNMSYEIQRSDLQWRELLNPREYEVLRQAGTEHPFTGELLDEARSGTYHCRACDNELFRAGAKFDAGCGWPSFWEPLREEAVEYHDDFTTGYKRVEVRCARCGSHLGHVFPDGFGTPTGDRYCMNSVCLKFVPQETPEQ